ncbi:mitochondrial cardiolipin hydrolase [Drosophila grimshawi]|uniref:mitochondrial cardiolipin hydrolase n=1 Tax=Drosophila grimshawi TaxID=7222 RepID=UPI000C870DB0|nr:mitochondrial cardiolipin hydrolase [Drosophila grimshawi]
MHHWATIGIGFGLGFGTVTLWHLGKLIRDQLKPQRELHEVFMFNELRYQCLQEHRKHNQAGTKCVCTNEYCVDRLVDQIVQELGRAKYSIDLAMFTLNSVSLERALLAAHRRGVIVRIILNKYSSSYDLSAAISRMITLGVLVRTVTSRYIMHHKFCVIDGCVRVEQICQRRRRSFGPPQPTLINGSLNWTDSGCTSNWESMVISTQPQLVSTFEAEFNRLWNSLEAKKLPKLVQTSL